MLEHSFSLVVVFGYLFCLKAKVCTKWKFAVLFDFIKCHNIQLKVLKLYTNEYSLDSMNIPSLN